jgi:hypothetical protein
MTTGVTGSFSRAVCYGSWGPRGGNVGLRERPPFASTGVSDTVWPLHRPARDGGAAVPGRRRKGYRVAGDERGRIHIPLGACLLRLSFRSAGVGRPDDVHDRGGERPDCFFFFFPQLVEGFSALWPDR